MGTRKAILWAAGVLSIGLCAVSPMNVFAQEEGSEETAPTNWKQEFRADVEQLKQQRDDMKSSAQAARQGEKDLIGQMQDAVQAGDYETAKSLRDQLHATHQENVAQMKQDRQALKEGRQELRSDVKEARESGVLPPRRPDRPGLRDRAEDIRDRREDIRDRREDRFDRREDFRDRREDVYDRREDIRDRREDRWDAKHNYPVGSPAWRKDKAEDIRDRREDIRDRREDRFDRREDVRDRKEDRFDRREDRRDRREDIRDQRKNPGNESIQGEKNKGNRGVRDHGKGEGRGKGQGGIHRGGNQSAGPRGGRRK